MPVVQPPLVLISPKGASFSSIEDDHFTYLQGQHVFFELTLAEYAAWAITSDTLVSELEEKSYDGSVISSSSLNLKRRNPNTGDVIAFPGMGAGVMYASFPYAVRFSGTPDDLDDYASALLIAVSSQITPFYHRDKFYLAVNSSHSGGSYEGDRYSDTWTSSPSHLKLEQFYTPLTGPPFVWRRFEFTLTL